MNAASEVNIRGLEVSDEPIWRQHWAAYLQFYKVDLAAEVTEALWRRLHDATSPIHGIVAEVPGDGVVGICHYVLHPNTWSDRSVCYLEDLFVDPNVRGRGTGRALIDWLKAEAERAGWSRLYWHTTEDNARARRLYDQVAKLSNLVRYAVEFPVGGAAP